MTKPQFIKPISLDSHSLWELDAFMVIIRPKVLLILVLLSGLIFVGGVGQATTAEDLYRKGFDLSVDGNSEASRWAYLQALKIRPDFAEAHHALGVLYFSKRQGVEAIDHFRKAEKYYQDRRDDQAKKNLTIVRRNLEKAYKEMGLTSEDFKIGSQLHVGFRWQTTGVGFQIGNIGQVITPYHVLRDAKKFQARFMDGTTAPLELVKKFVVYNIAVLKLTNPESRSSRILYFGDDSRLEVGDPVYAVDFSKLSHPGTPLYQGAILKKNAVDNSKKVFQLDLQVKADHSGGPLLNKSGQVIGMLLTHRLAKKSFTNLVEASKKASFAVKSSYLHQILSSLPGSAKPGGRSEKTIADNSMELRISSNAFKKNFIFIEKEY